MSRWKCIAEIKTRLVGNTNLVSPGETENYVLEAGRAAAVRTSTV